MHRELMNYGQHIYTFQPTLYYGAQELSTNCQIVIPTYSHAQTVRTVQDVARVSSKIGNVEMKPYTELSKMAAEMLQQ